MGPRDCGWNGVSYFLRARSNSRPRFPNRRPRALRDALGHLFRRLPLKLRQRNGKMGPVLRAWQGFRLSASLGITLRVFLAVAAFGLRVAGPLAEAQAYRVLHSFTANDGTTPFGALLRVPSTGNLFGTTSQPGGTVFKLDTTGAFTSLYSFIQQADGQVPEGTLIRDSAGNLYGTAYFGGNPSCVQGNGCGTIFKLYEGKLTVLHTFAGQDGANPAAGLVRDLIGNLYGTTFFGGTSSACPDGCGTVFKLDTSGTLTTLHSFTGSFNRDGAHPLASLVRDAAGNFYGTTQSGGAAGHGTVFKLNPASGKYAVLHSFTGPPDGAEPRAALIRDAAGNLYGTTYYGGTSHQGTVFKILNRTITVLYSFAGSPDGSHPSAGLVLDSTGNLYGTTYTGGTGPCNQAGVTGCGTVFRLDTGGTLEVLHNFAGALHGNSDGAYPRASLTMDSAGNLYSTTSQGGLSNDGTVFELPAP